MALEEYTVSQNTGHVEQAVGGMAEGQIADIERRAKAQVAEVESERAKAESAEHAAKAPVAKGNQEVGLYGDLAMEAIAPGLKLAKTAIEFLDERKMDAAQGGLDNKHIAAVTSSAPARTIDQDISTAMRQPGLYRAPVASSVYDGAQARSDIGAGAGVKRTKLSVEEGEDVMMRANIAETSLKDQGKDAIASWGVKDAKIASVQHAKELTVGLRNSNDLALQSAHVARQHNSAIMYKANQLAPGLSLASGPTIRPDQLLSEAQRQSDWSDRT